MNTNKPSMQFGCELLLSKEINKKDPDNHFTLLPLLYAENALEPYISSRTIQFHYGKHLLGYIDNTNKMKAGTEFDQMPLEEIVVKSSDKLFNNASQVYNHYFQFEAFRAYDASKAIPQGILKQKIEENFGNFEEFKKKFAEAATTLFGSGYAWLVIEKDGKLSIIQTKNAENPLREGRHPLLNLDVWEHAYYLDVQNLRAKYVENFWHIIDWEKVGQRLACHMNK